MRAIGLHEPRPERVDLFYVGGGQDREQALVAPDLAAKADALREAVDGGAAFLAVCGGYQLLGRSIATSRARSCPGSACCRCTRSPASAG